MDGLPLDKEVLDRTPPEVIRLLVELFDRIEKLELENARLKALLKQNSSNSSKPPSSDPPDHKRKPPQPKSGRARGGQPGHPRHERPLVPPEQVDEIVACRPTNCAGCGVVLVGNDPQPKRHQVAEIPPIQPHVTEYKIHTLACPRCGGQTTGSLPAGTPSGCFGPRLAAVVSLLSGAYRLGKRPIRQLLLDLCGLTISTGMICKLQQQTATLLQAVYHDLRQHIQTQNVNIDETGWKENTNKGWLWVVVAPMAAVFYIAGSRGKDVVEQLLGEFPFVATCDRWQAYRRPETAAMVLGSSATRLPGDDRSRRSGQANRRGVALTFERSVPVVASRSRWNAEPRDVPSLRWLAAIGVPRGP